MDNTITITPSGISIASPLVAGTQLSVTATDMEVAEGATLFLVVTSRFPDLLIASCPLSETTTEGEYAGTLYTATKQMSLFLVNARADEARSASIELVDTAHGASLARTTVPIYNSSLIPQPCRWPSASPLYVPGPAASVLVGTTTTLPPGSPATVENVGTTSDAVFNFGIPKGEKGDTKTPSDTPPQMDGSAAAGTSDEYARGDHRHPTDTSRMPASYTGENISLSPIGPTIAHAVNSLNEGLAAKQDTISDLTAIRSGAAAGATAVQPAALSDYRTATAQDAIDGAQDTAIAAKYTKPATGIPAGDLAAGVIPSVPSASTATPQMDGTGAAGTANTYARGDHQHPSDTTRLALVEDKNGNLTAITIGSRYSEEQVGPNSMATGTNLVATASGSHAEGYLTEARGGWSHAEGNQTSATGNYSHAEGENTVAAGASSHASGHYASTEDSGGNANEYAFAWNGNTGSTVYRSHGAGTFNINPAPASGSTDPATGFWIGETKLSNYVRYSFASPTPTVSGTAATVACEDRAINDFTVATGLTSLTITPPAAVTGRARDFFCRVTLTGSSLPTVTLSGGTIDIGATEVAGMTRGVNLLMFTEIASGHWLASRRSAS